MQNRSFSIGEVLRLGWAKFKEQPLVWIAALALVFFILGTHVPILNWASGHGFSFTVPEHASEHLTFGPWEILVNFIYLILQAGLSLGLAYMGLRAADNIPLNISDLFARFQYVFSYVIAYLLYSLIIFVGLILLVFPAFIWGTRYSLFPYFIADQGVGPIQALKMSSQATYGAKWDVFGLIVASLCLAFVGGLLLMIGLLVVVPVLCTAWAGAYRRLTKSEQLPTEIISP